MIEVIVNRPSFEYDIHSLVKSFFPREDVQIHVQDTFSEDTALRISVEFTDETVSICLMERGRDIRDRICPIVAGKVKKCIKCDPCAIMEGLAGAGAFSDGKYVISTEYGGRTPT